MSDPEPDVDPEIEGSPRPPTRVPGVWKQLPLLVKVLVVVLVLVAAGGVVVANRLTNDSTAELGNGTIVQLTPLRDSQIVAQDQVGIRLATGYTAQLSVNGVPLPDDQLDVIPAFNQFLFKPGEGKAFEEWPKGQRSCVTATYWRFETGPADASTYTWCFTAV